MPDLPDTPFDDALTPEEKDLKDQLVSEEARALGGVTDTDLYVADQFAKEQESRETLDVLEGLRKLQSGDPIRWAIWRVDGQDPDKHGYLATWSTARLTQDRLRDEFGAGVYRIEGTLPNGQYVRRRTVTIAEDAPRRVKENMTPNTGFNMQEFLAQQEAIDNRRQQREDERRRQDAEREEKRRQERKELMIALGPAALAAVAAIFGKQGPDITAIAAAMKGPDPLALLANLKSLIPPPPSPGPTSMDQALKVLEVIMDKGAVNRTGETGVFDIFKELVKVAGPSIGGVIETAVQRAQAAQQAPPGSTTVVQPAQLPSPPRAPVTMTSPSFESATRAPSGPEQDMNMLGLLPLVPFMREQLDRCLKGAAKGSDPELYAAMLLEELPEGIDPQALAGFIARADWFQHFQQFDERVTAHYPWFTRLRRHVLQFIAEAGQGETATIPEGAGKHAGETTPVVHVVGPGAAHDTPKEAALAQPAAPAPPVAEIRRPTKLPSITGEE